MTRRRLEEERGAVTVLAVAMLAVLVLVASAIAVGEAMVVAHRRAQAAADLAALASAQAVQHARDPCDAASRVATANGAALTACAVAGYDVTISVTVAGPRWLGAHGDFGARAKAGPA